MKKIEETCSVFITLIFTGFKMEMQALKKSRVRVWTFGPTLPQPFSTSTSAFSKMSQQLTLSLLYSNTIRGGITMPEKKHDNKILKWEMYNKK